MAFAFPDSNPGSSKFPVVSCPISSAPSEFGTPGKALIVLKNTSQKSLNETFSSRK